MLPDIKSLSASQLESLLVEKLAQPNFRLKQVEQWLWQKGASSFDDMTNISKDLRAKLAEHCSLSVPTIDAKQISLDGTRKYLMRFADGVAVESVGIRRQAARWAAPSAQPAGAALRATSTLGRCSIKCAWSARILARA